MFSPMHLRTLVSTLPSASPDDLRRLAYLITGWATTGLTPHRFDRGGLVGLMGRSAAREKLIRRNLVRMQAILGSRRPEMPLDRVSRDFGVMGSEIAWTRWRALHGGRTSVETTVEGMARWSEAVERGKGVILWGLSFCGTLVVKIGLATAGVKLVHLSTADHGVSIPSTPFGRAVVSPLYCAAENHFIHERVIIPHGGTLSYMRTLMARLAENETVYISGDQRSHRTNVRVRAFDKPVELAQGAAGLSWKLGSPLLPVLVTREGPFRYRAIIDEPIAPDRSLEKDAFVAEATKQFVGRLEAHVMRYPADFDWWGSSVAWQLNRTAVRRKDPQG